MKSWIDTFPVTVTPEEGLIVLALEGGYWPDRYSYFEIEGWLIHLLMLSRRGLASFERIS